MSSSPPSSTSTPENSTRRVWLARGSVALLVGYWLLLITATHIPKVPEPLGFRPSDKLVHLAAYAVLGALVGLVIAQYRRLRLWLAVVLLVGLAVHGALDEVTQPLFGRHADVADWVADILGATLGLSLVLAAIALLGQKPTPARTRSGPKESNRPR